MAPRQYQSVPIMNGLVPDKGPLGVRVDLDFTAAQLVRMDLIREIGIGVIDLVQSIYIDNGSNAQPISIEFSGLMYKITCRANRQGIFPVIGLSGQLQLSAATAGAVIVPIILINVPMQTATWDV
jgi:hypothetical protein